MEAAFPIQQGHPSMSFKRVVMRVGSRRPGGGDRALDSDWKNAVVACAVCKRVPSGERVLLSRFDETKQGRRRSDVARGVRVGADRGKWRIPPMRDFGSTRKTSLVRYSPSTQARVYGS